MPAAIEHQPLQCRFNTQEIVRRTRVWHHFAVLGAAGAITTHRRDQVTTLLITAREDRDAYGNLQRADPFSAPE
jgi:hypothetical protein